MSLPVIHIINLAPTDDFFRERIFQGLEQRLGQDAPAVLEQGRSGIARGYRDVDHPPSSQED